MSYNNFYQFYRLNERKDSGQLRLLPKRESMAVDAPLVADLTKETCRIRT